MNPRWQFFVATILMIVVILSMLFAIFMLSMPGHPNLKTK